jgi:hypothetical protein
MTENTKFVCKTINWEIQDKDLLTTKAQVYEKKKITI